MPGVRKTYNCPEPEAGLQAVEIRPVRTLPAGAAELVSYSPERSGLFYFSGGVKMKAYYNENDKGAAEIIRATM